MDADVVVHTNLADAMQSYSACTIPIVHFESGEKFAMMVSQEMIDQAVQLRAESKSYKQIARIMEVSSSVVHNLIVASGKTRETPPAESVRALELDKLDNLERAGLEVLWANEGEGGSATRVLAAIDRLIRIGESRRKLLGLDAPQVMEHLPVEIQLNGVNVDGL